MFSGGLIAESIRMGERLDGIPLTIRRIARGAVDNATPEQPAVWTLIEFDLDDADAERLAGALSAILASPGWYTDFQSPSEVFVVFPGRIFRYQRGDREAQAEVRAHGRSVGIPESQLDWEEPQGTFASN